MSSAEEKSSGQNSHYADYYRLNTTSHPGATPRQKQLRFIQCVTTGDNSVVTLCISGSAFEFHILRQPRVSASSRSRTPPIKAAYTCDHVTLRLHVEASFWVRTRQRNRQVCLKSAIITGRRFFPIFTRTFTKAVHAGIMWPLGGTTTGKISSSSNISTCWRSHGSSTRSCICDLLSHN